MHNLPAPAIVRSFRHRLHGDVVLPGDAGYEEARAIWNGRFDPRPLAIVQCRSTDDVVETVRFVRQHDLPLSVRGGGHGYAGHSGGDGALVLDLAPMDSVEVDPERARAVVGPGATWAAFDAAAQTFGLAATGPTVSTVGVAGYVLGGGTGYLARRFGLGLDHLLSVEAVTAEGRVVRASGEENPTLFWALRGGSGNFAVVTAFELRLHRVGPEIVVAQAFHAMEDAGPALRFYRDFAAAAPEEVSAYAFALRVPPVEPFPEEVRGRPALALIASHCGDPDRGEAVLAPFARSGTPFLAAVQRLPYTAAQQAFDAGMPKGLRWYTRAHYVNDLSDEALEMFATHVEELPGAFTLAYFEPLGGAIARVPGEATAFSHRDAAYGLHIFPGWSDPGDDEVMMAWAREFHAAMEPHATGGVYVNLLGEDEEARVPNAYGPSYERLIRIKAEWDPENLFRATWNIPPER